MLPPATVGGSGPALTAAAANSQRSDSRKYGAAGAAAVLPRLFQHMKKSHYTHLLVGANAVAEARSAARIATCFIMVSSFYFYL